MSTTVIHRTDTIKFLGIVLDDKLNFKGHIVKLSQDHVRLISSTKITRKWVPKKEKLQIYYAFIHAKTQYGLEVSGTARETDIKKVLQHKAMKVLFNLPPDTPSKLLYKENKIPLIPDIFHLNAV